MTARAQTVTILFTDLVGSTELLQRAGDEQAQRIFKAHHRLLREAVEAHGGHEVKWLGDGLMVAFDSTADAVKCAIAMQQASRRPTAGERLEIRAGLNVGEAFVDESDYFGTSVVIARRLCDSGGAGAIRASDIVVRLLDGRGDGLQTKDLGPLDLKGITNPVPAVEIVYEHDPMALLRKLPFVGRHDEYEAMLKKLAEARNNRGSVILLAGEPGIGKTRLTEEFCEHASSGATVIRGNCYEGDVAAPFGPWVEALRSLIEQTPDAELRETLGPGAPDIAGMMPEVRRRLPDLEESLKLDPESERARLFESISAFLRNAAEQKPLVIFLDDLHWCDRPSLALLEQVARGIAEKKIVIVGTYRDVEVDRVHPLAQTLAALRRMEHHERIAIRGFTQESVYDLLHAIEPSEQAEVAKRGLAQVLFTESEGNPFFLREVLNNLVETGKLAQQDGVWTGTVASVEELGIPEGIKEVIGRRMSRLSEGCNRMLGRASAMTSGFTWDELRAICDDPEDTLLDALDEALGSQLIAERDSDTYAFTHALIRATLYDELSKPRRVQLHRRIAESLESLYADSIDDHLGELAAHYMASTGNAAEKAVEYSIRAGDRAQERFAWEEATAHYERALEAMDLTKAPHDEARCRVLLSFSESGRAHGIDDVARLRRVREAVAIARTISSGDLLARAAIEFNNVAGTLETDLATERVALLDEALRALGAEDSALRVSVLCERVTAASAFANSRAGISAAGFLGFAGEKEEHVLQQARDAVAMAERLNDDVATAEAISRLRTYGWTPDNDLERLTLSDRGLAAARRAGSARLEADLCNDRSMDLLALGNIGELERSNQYQAALAKRLRVDHVEFNTIAVEIGLDAAAGRLERAEVAAQRPSTQTRNVSAAISSFTQVYFLRYLQGRLPELQQAWRNVVVRFPGLPIYPATLALVEASAGQHDEAERQLDQLVKAGSVHVARDYLWKPTLSIAAEACAEIPVHAHAATLYDSLLPYAPTCLAITMIAPLGSMARVVARLATVLERYDEAEQHFEFAIGHNERMGFHAWTAWTRLDYGDMLLRRNRPGDRDRATALLQQAHDFAKESGMGKVERDSERLLASLA